MSETSEAQGEERALGASFVRTRAEEDFRALYQLCTPRMFTFALRLCGGNHAEAEDLVQESWLRAVQALPRFQWRSSLRTWLCGFVANCYREANRERLNQTVAEVEEVAAPATSSGELEQLVQRLPDRCREVLVLHDIEGYTHAEIGEALGIAEGTSKHHLFRARQMLSAALRPARGRTS